LRVARYPNCPYVFFWFDYRFDKNGEQIQRFEAFWRQAVTALGEKMKADGLNPSTCTSTTSAVQCGFQKRKAGIDSHTSRDIMGHQNTSTDEAALRRVSSSGSSSVRGWTRCPVTP
jgi:hypothetical protein